MAAQVSDDGSRIETGRGERGIYVDTPASNATYVPERHGQIASHPAAESRGQPDAAEFELEALAVESTRCQEWMAESRTDNRDYLVE